MALDTSIRVLVVDDFATMRRIVKKWDEDDPTCSGANGPKWLQGNPGILSAQCLKSMGVTAIDTRHHKKWHHFHAFPLTRMVSGDVDGWYKNKHEVSV